MDSIRETEVLVDTAVLGEQVDSFMRSDVGKYLLKNIDTEYLGGIHALKIANPDIPSEVRSAQNRVWRAEELRSWLQSSVHAGLKAIAVLESREDEDNL